MNKLMAVFLAFMVLVPGAAWCAEELKIFTWSEYMDEENMPKQFEEATGIKVHLDMYESNEEMMA